MKKFWGFFLLQVVIASENAYYTKILLDPEDNYNCLIIEQNNLKFKGFETSDTNELKIISKLAVSAPADMMIPTKDKSKIIEIFAKTLSTSEAYTASICKSKENIPEFSSKRQGTLADPEVVNIVDGGDQSNRIDGVFMEDRYTSDERSQFFDDIQRLTSTSEACTASICRSKENIPEFSSKRQGTLADPEVVKIVDGGDQSNRIDVVFMGDGYTSDERSQFFEDIERLTEEMFGGITFSSYLPLFNIWAIYVESVDSGIGYDGPKDTPFRLYRKAAQLRGIYTGNKSFAREVCRLTGPGGCDYPSIIANDDYYGGLGGEFVISTKSNRTGTVVLRHEMGHNFINVGEEYDNGQVYKGVNSASDIDVAVAKWGHWIRGHEIQIQRVIYRMLEYPWADLKNGQQTFNFYSDGNYSRWYLQVSVSAAGEAGSLEFVLDGVILPWESRGFDDREFYSWYGHKGFPEGNHTFSVRSLTEPTNANIPRMICSINLHEFGNEDEFNMDNDFVSAYPTWDVRRRITYRPTNAGCLMRNMTHNELCSICKEGMWHQFLERISLIDNVTVSDSLNLDLSKTVTLSTLKLAHFRQPDNHVAGERLEVRWFYSGIEQTRLNNRFTIYARRGAWRVSVQFITPEVRYDPNLLLHDTVNFTVGT